MVLASRERKPPVDSIFRAGLRVRSARAVSAPRAATTLCRSPPCRQRWEGFSAAVAIKVIPVMASHKKTFQCRISSAGSVGTKSQERRHCKMRGRKEALRKFRASLLPIVLIIVWNVKKYGAARACPRVRKSHHRCSHVWQKLFSKDSFTCLFVLISVLYIFYFHLNDSRNSKESGKMFLFEDDLVMVRFSIFVIFRDVFCVSRFTDFWITYLLTDEFNSTAMIFDARQITSEINYFFGGKLS